MKNFLWGSVDNKFLAVLDEENRCYMAMINERKEISSIVGVLDTKRFYPYVDSKNFYGINIVKAHKYLEKFAETLRHPVDNDVAIQSVF